MGKINNVFYEALIDDSPDRNANLLKVYQKDNGEVVIHFRNLKIVLLTQEDRLEWREGFTTALKRLRDNNYFPDDI